MTIPQLTLNGGTYKIADLVGSEFILDGLNATDVVFIGPAVLALLPGNLELTDTRTSNNIEALLWEIEKGRTTVTGAIGIRNCTFTRCVFDGIGFAGPSDTLAQFTQMMRV
jgi:hypothetical protein